MEPDEYFENLTDLNCLKFILIAKVLENKKFYVDETKFQLFNQDSIQIKVSQCYLNVASLCYNMPSINRVFQTHAEGFQ